MHLVASVFKNRVFRLSARVALLVSTAALFGIGCATQPNASAPSTEYALIDRAVAELPEIEPRAQRIHAAGEAAITLGELNRPARAREIIDEELTRATFISDAGEQAIALVGLAESSADIDGDSGHLAVMSAAWESLDRLKPGAKKSDLTGKLLVAAATRRADPDVLAAALAMSEADDNQSSFKARTLHKLAPAFATQVDVATAESILQQITMGLSYYQAGAYADVAAIAFKRDQAQVANRLLAKAEVIARAQNDGYFRAGALRRIASAYSDGGNSDTAMALFTDAGAAAVEGKSAQHRARALSRVATTLSDHSYYSLAGKLLSDAVRIADSEENDQLRFWTYYEVAGASAFAGKFDLANTLVAKIPEELKFSGSHVRYAAERDIAWGYAKHQMFDEAASRAEAIVGARERAQALSRIARIAGNPGMRSLSRYL